MGAFVESSLGVEAELVDFGLSTRDKPIAPDRAAGVLWSPEFLVFSGGFWIALPRIDVGA